jgi:hypothetical protein
MSHETYNQNGEVVLTCECAHFLRRRPGTFEAQPPASSS